MIKTEHVTKVYKDSVVALEDVNIEVRKGEFVFVVGPSGSGKSTFIRLLLKEEEPSRGAIYVAGKNIANLSPWKVPYLRRNIGTVFQDFKLLPDRTVFDNVAFALEVIGKQRNVIDRRVPEILELVGLGEKLNNYPDELSGGEQQRVAIARALTNDPDIIFADEPTGNLDSKTGDTIIDLLLNLAHNRKKTLLVVTHDSHLAGRGDRQLRIVDGMLA